MLARIREAWTDACKIMLEGTVEVDETYIGGKEGHKHANKRLGKNHWQGKSVVIGGKSRNGKVSAIVVDDTEKETLHGFITVHRNLPCANTRRVSKVHVPTGRCQNKYQNVDRKKN